MFDRSLRLAVTEIGEVEVVLDASSPHPATGQSTMFVTQKQKLISSKASQWLTVQIRATVDAKTSDVNWWTTIVNKWPGEL